MKQNLKDIPAGEWPALLTGLGLKGFAAGQIYQWLFMKGATSFGEMTNLSKDARRILDENFSISRLKIIDLLEDPDDGAKKFLFELSDGNRIETVLMPEGDSPRDYKTCNGRVTLCVSSQVGCALDCRFCRTAGIGFKRNLTVSEIVDQVLEVLRHPHEMSSFQSQMSSSGLTGGSPSNPEDPLDNRGIPHQVRNDKRVVRNDSDQKITNIVFMGMGEPLNNYENVKEAIQIMTSENGLMFAKRRVTLSTAGIVPGIEKMTADRLGVKLAVSLNATTDEGRAKIMPIARRYSIDEILRACWKYAPPGSRWRTTFEYVLIDGINDSKEDMKRLAELMSRLPSKVNLIPFNPYPGCPYKKPKEMVLKEFDKYLYDKNIQVFIRKSRGSKIMAACGQLAGRER